MADVLKDDDQVEESQGPDFLDMSDDEIAAFDPSKMGSAAAEVTDPANDAGDETTGADNTATKDDADDEAAEAGNEVTGAEVPAGDPHKDGADKKAPSATDPEDDGDKTTKADAAKDPAATDAAAAIDYEAAYKQLIAPFKANGRDIQVKSVEDAIALMQMGANYNKKMAGLKPNLKLMKMLESNGLLSEEKLGFLIDLDKKNPEAINKLIKDSGMDPMDLSTDKADQYRPGNHAVDERELELDEVLGELSGTPTYNRTLDVVSNKWDKASKVSIAAKPEILKVINAHMENGIYDLIHTEMESERTFGRLKGLSDLEAYRQVGDSIQARGGFAHLGHQKAAAPTAPVIVQPKPTLVDDAKLRDKKRAASSTKTAVSSTTPEGFNPLDMSDEEFAKFKPKF